LWRTSRKRQNINPLRVWLRPLSNHARKINSISSSPHSWNTLYQLIIASNKLLLPFSRTSLQPSLELVEWSGPASMPTNGINPEIDLLNSGTR
jgi:hypothetical protein